MNADMSPSLQAIEAALADDRVNIYPNHLSTNGYWVYDIRLQNTMGFKHCGLSLYSEEPAELELIEQTSHEPKLFIKLIQQFPQVVHQKKQLSLMSNAQSLAFCHLLDKASRQNAMMNYYYGVAHLVAPDKILVFNQSQPFKAGIDFSKPASHYIFTQQIYTLWRMGRIEPQVIFEGKALEQLTQSTKGSLAQYPLSKLLYLLNEFAWHFNSKLNISSCDEQQMQLHLNDIAMNIKAYENNTVLFTKGTEPPVVKTPSDIITMLSHTHHDNKLNGFLRWNHLLS